MFKKFTIIAVLVFLSLNVYAKNKEKEELDAYLKQMEERGGNSEYYKRTTTPPEKKFYNNTRRKKGRIKTTDKRVDKVMIPTI
jgi:hypothetical protein